MKLKLRCILQLDIPQMVAVDVAEDINIIDIADNTTDEQFVTTCNRLRELVKQKHQATIMSLFKVVLEEIKN